MTKHYSVVKALVALLGVVGIAAAQPGAELGAQLTAAEETLRELSSDRLGPWRFQWPAQEGGEAVALDDSKWEQVWPEHIWHKPNSQAWYRITILVPERIGLAPMPGGPLILEAAADDDGEIYVNGELRQQFHWNEGRVELSPNARPGDKFVVALKVINGPVHGRLMAATLRYQRLEPIRWELLAHASRLRFVEALMQVEGSRAEITEAARRCLEAIQWECLASKQTGESETSAKRESVASSNNLSPDVEAFRISLGKSAQELAPVSPIAKKYTLHLVGHAHIDMNWLWLWPETIDVCEKTWRQAIAFMREFPEFRFSESQPAAYRAIEEHHPDLFADMQGYAKEGRWDATCATWVQGDTNLASGEALCRQLLTAREYMMEKFGQWTKTAWLPDNFGHAWTVPTIFRDAGIEWYYFARCGPGLPLFWWEGPDGSRLAAYNYGGYSWRVEPSVATIPLDLRRRAGVHSAMIAYGVGDHGGGPTRHDIETALWLQKEPAAPRVKFSRTDEFFEAVLGERTDLPVVRKELNFTFRGCYTTHADMKRRNRELENLLPTAEAAATTATVLCGRPYPRRDLLEAWRNVCFNQFHDLLPGSAIHESYDFCHKLYDEAEATARRELVGSLQALATQVNTAGEGTPVLVWNTLGWPRQGLARVTLQKAPEGPVMAVGPDHASVLAQVTPRGDGFAEVEFMANVPACGWAVWHLLPAKAAPTWDTRAYDAGSEIVLENARVKAVIDKKCGALKSLYDKRGNRQLVRLGDRAAMLQVLWEEPHAMSAWEIGPIRWTRDLDEADEVAIENKAGANRGPIVRVTHTYGRSRFVQRIAIARDEPRLDFELEADWREKGNRQDGSPMLKVAFPLRMEQPVFTCDIPFGTVERQRDGQDVPAQKWADLTEVRLRGRSGDKPLPVDLTPYFNQDAFATTDEPGDGDFDGWGMSYPAEMLGNAHEGMLEWEGLPWRAPPTASKAKNAVACRSQTIMLPARTGGSLALFGAAAPGSHVGNGALAFADGSRDHVEIGFSDWCYGPGPDETIVLRHPYRYNRQGRAEPEPRIFVRFLQLPQTKRVRALILPDNPQIRLFAITLAPHLVPEPLYGVSVLNDCKYGYDAKGSTLRLTLLRASYDPDPEPDVGKHRIRYSVLLHDGDWRTGGTVRQACEFNSSLEAIVAASHEGTLPSSGSFVRVEPHPFSPPRAPDSPPLSNIVLSAVKLAEDGRGVIVRWYETDGHDTPTRVRTAFRIASAELTNVVEAAQRARLHIGRGGELLVTTPAHGVVTVRLIPSR